MLALTLGMVAGCNQNMGLYATSPGNTPNRPPQTAFRVLGQTGLQFSATVSDTVASWVVQGAIPMSVVVVNGTPPTRIVVTKLAAGSGILSVQLTAGYTVEDVSSTTAPFGTVSLQTGSVQPGFSPPAPAANPDIRYYVKGPRGERFNGLIEDESKGYTISDRAPTVFLFESPSGKTDGLFNQIQDFGPFDIDLVVDGTVAAAAEGGPSLSIRQP